MSKGLLAIGNRARVDRLLCGEIRKEDIHELFFIMRDDVRGSGWVPEITHFFAHPNARDQGLIWRDVSARFAFLKFRIPLSQSRIIAPDLPASMPEALRENLRRMRKTTLLKETGKTRVQAEKLLSRVLARSVPTGPGRLSKLKCKTQEELDTLICVVSHIKGGPLFTANDVFEDFCRGLEQRKLLQSEKTAFKKIKPAIGLYCLTVMHNRQVDLGHNGRATLTIGAASRATRDFFDVGNNHMGLAQLLERSGYSKPTYQ